METADARENSSSSLSFPSPLPFPGGSGWSHIILTIIHSSISTNQYKTNNILHRTIYKYSCDYLGFYFLPHPASCCGPGRTSSFPFHERLTKAHYFKTGKSSSPSPRKRSVFPQEHFSHRSPLSSDAPPG